MPFPMTVGTTVMMNSSIASSSRKDAMISPVDHPDVLARLRAESLSLDDLGM
jgi:hypothetical protein